MDRAFIIYELVKSARVAGHLLRNMDEAQMAEFICKAPITVWWKCDLLKEFGFPQYAQIGEAAQHSLKENRGQKFSLRSFLSAWEFENREFASYEEVERQLINNPLRAWHILDGWENGQKTWSFYYTGPHLIYFSHWEAVSKGDTDSLLFAPNNMSTVDLPNPFHVGDLLEIDCTPFAPVKHALVMSEDMQILYLDAYGEVCVDKLESGCIFGTGYHNVIPPLYGVDTIRYGGEWLLMELRSFIDGEVRKAAYILRCFRRYANRDNRMEQDHLQWLMRQYEERIGAV